jgi:hypothetical protein
VRKVLGHEPVVMFDSLSELGSVAGSGPDV